jgi:hypothetical protein
MFETPRLGLVHNGELTFGFGSHSEFLVKLTMLPPFTLDLFRLVNSKSTSFSLVSRERTVRDVAEGWNYHCANVAEVRADEDEGRRRSDS